MRSTHSPDVEHNGLTQTDAGITLWCVYETENESDGGDVTDVSEAFAMT